MPTIQRSKLRDSLEKNQFAEFDDTFLATFRQPGHAIDRLTVWPRLCIQLVVTHVPLGIFPRYHNVPHRKGRG